MTKNIYIIPLAALLIVSSYFCENSYAQSASPSLTSSPLRVSTPALNSCLPSDVRLSLHDVFSLLLLSKQSMTGEAQAAFHEDVLLFQHSFSYLERGECMVSGSDDDTPPEGNRIFNASLSKAANGALYILDTVLDDLVKNNIRQSFVCGPISRSAISSDPLLVENEITSAYCCRVQFCASPEVASRIGKR